MLEPKFVNLPWCKLSDVARFMLLFADGNNMSL